MTDELGNGGSPIPAPLEGEEYPTHLNFSSLQQPSYSTWSQFSGITQSQLQNDNFEWNISHSPERMDYNYNMNPMATTMSADLTNNLLPSQNPIAQSFDKNLVFSSEIQDGVFEPLNFDDTSKQGFQMYAEALKNWKSYSNQYDPFKTSDVFGQPSPVSKESNNITLSKPSYSEVAKSLKTKPIQPSKDVKSDSEAPHCKFVFSDPPTKVYKPVRKLSGKNYQHRGRSSPPTVSPTIDPDSKYGLDQFEVLSPDKTDSSRRNSQENISMRVRQNSSSSVSSGASGSEEILLAKTINSISNKAKDVSNLKETINSSKGNSKENNKSSPQHGISSDKEKEPFFDARRIFQFKSCNSKNKSMNLKSQDTMVLNNGKPASLSRSSSNVHKKTSDYINNDLRDKNKKTNQNLSNKENENEKQNKPQQCGQSSRNEKTKSKSSSSGSSESSSNCVEHNVQFPSNYWDQEVIDEWVGYLSEKIRIALHKFWSYLVTLLILLSGLVLYLVTEILHLVIFFWSLLKRNLKSYFSKSKYFSNAQEWMKDKIGKKRRIGLDENILLPSTGDEAMHRLLACKGKDPYSILGLKADASDEDIKKYYRKQAVLVHPDKNKQPGAEEGFKILGHAFELIGDPVKRKVYDAQMQESEAEVAMKEFADLLTKLEEKLQEAANMMRCDNCGGKHKRVPMERPWYSARFCDRCNIRHSAKEGDVWAETTMLGFLWHYYACMDGKVYDITEWVACQKKFFKQMQANSHHIFYRIATEGNRGHRQNKSGESELEDFLNHLFHRAMQSDGASQWQQQQQQPPKQQQPNPQTDTQQNWNPAGPFGKKKRNKKKKH